MPHTLFSKYWVRIVPLKFFLELNSEVGYIKCLDQISFDYSQKPFFIDKKTAASCMNG